jgi:phage terminase large subunit
MENEFDFKHPDYGKVYEKRSKMLRNLRESPEILKALKEHYKNNPVDFINDWGMTSDPRNAEVGLPISLPFILFPKQREFVQWLHERWLNREDGLAEKSRDIGASWICVGFSSWMWEFYPGSIIGFGSRKEEYVDKSGDPKSLFWKVRKFIEFLPKEFKPKGYNENKHALYMRILNPENEAAIVGESGDNIGRGARTSIYFKDESAFYERPDSIDAALSQTSNCKIDISTPNGNGNPFYRKRHSGKIPVFSFRWTDDPRKDDAWYQKQVNALDAVIVAQEIDIDYNASVADSFINGDLISTAQRTKPLDIEINGTWMIGVDAAHFGDDNSIVHSRRGRFNAPQLKFSKIDGPTLAAAVEDHCNTLIEAGGEIGAIVIELDGPGVSCFDQLKLGKYADKVRGVHTGATLSDNKNHNLRAKMWRSLRDYLAEPPIVMDNEPDIKSELASMRYGYKNGLLLMQSKKEYKKMYGKSPDRADAMALTFAVVPKLPQVAEVKKRVLIGQTGLRRGGNWLRK